MPKSNGYLNQAATLRLVEVHMQFCRIGEIDTINEKYQAEIYIEAKWIEKEPLLTSYDPKKHWNPMLDIENAIQIGKETIEYDLMRDRNNPDYTVVTEVRYLKGWFWERLELHHFPIDIQELSVSVISKLSSSEVKLVSDDKRLSFVNLDASNTFVDQQKWKLFKLVKVSDSASYDSNKDYPLNIRADNVSNLFNEMSRPPLLRRKPPKIVATCYCARKPGYYLFNAYFLIFLITVSSLTLFSVDCKLPQNRLQINVTLMLTSVSFKWVINRYLPTVSYLTSLDWYAIICIFYVCLMCAWNGIIGSSWEADKPYAESVDFWAFVVFACMFFLINMGVGVWFFMVYDQIRKLKQREALFLLLLNENFCKANTNNNNTNNIVIAYVDPAMENRL